MFFYKYALFVKSPMLKGYTGFAGLAPIILYRDPISKDTKEHELVHVQQVALIYAIMTCIALFLVGDWKFILLSHPVFWWLSVMKRTRYWIEVQAYKKSLKYGRPLKEVVNVIHKLYGHRLHKSKAQIQKDLGK